VELPKISVVIPVYNGERYLVKTLDCLLRQTFRDFEAICINDCSTDNSESVLRRYAQTDPRVRLLKTESNQGIVPKVLKYYALPNLRGEYYAYSSQDDLFSDDWLEKMWCKAVATGADAVIPDLVFYHVGDTSKNRTLAGVQGDRSVVLSNRDAVILSLDWIIPGNALWKTSLVQRLGYEDFGMFADEYSMRVFFYHCNRVVFSGGTFYYGQDNPDAITKKSSYKSFDSPYNHFRLYEFLKENTFDFAIYSKELLKAATGVRQKRQELIFNRAAYTPEESKEALNRIQKCYNAITQSEAALEVLRRQRGLKNSLAGFPLKHGRLIFEATCRFMVLLRRTKRLALFLPGR
jgi:glycosyltransferase involved in cell wall biosynthesis